MVQIQKLPDAEFEVMKAMWQLTPPVTAGMLMEVLAGDAAKPWKLQTLHSFLGRLEDRGFIASQKRGKERTFSPLVKRSDYLEYETAHFVRHYHEGSLLNLVNTAYQGKGLSEADIDELAQWANALRKKP